MAEVNESKVKYRVESGEVFPVVGETDRGDLILGERIA